MFSLVLVSCQSPTLKTAYSHCSQLVAESAWVPPKVRSNTTTEQSFEVLTSALGATRVILIGELHNRYDHHLTQLELICRLHAHDARVAIGVEFVQQRFQTALDDYLQHRLDEDGFLRHSEYFDRWGFDYRLYAPILRFARAREIPVIALNVPGEITTKIARQGLDALSQEESQFVPAGGLSADENYRKRLQIAYEEHAGVSSSGFENFLNAQLLWDSGMAQRASRYLREQPTRRLIILAGNGHVAYRNAIANRIEAIPANAVTIVTQGQLANSDADHELQSTALQLPPAGKLGVLLDINEEGVRIGSFTPDSAAPSVGLKTGDLIKTLDGHPTPAFVDVKLMLWRKTAGDVVLVTITRDGENLSFEVTLK